MTIRICVNWLRCCRAAPSGEVSGYGVTLLLLLPCSLQRVPSPGASPLFLSPSPKRVGMQSVKIAF